MIERVSFHNFKAIRAADIDLERLTVFVGPNASGKTSVLEGLYYLAKLAGTKPQDLFQGPRDPSVLRSRGAEASMVLSATLRVRGRMDTFSLVAQQATKRRGSSEWECSCQLTQGGKEVSFARRGAVFSQNNEDTKKGEELLNRISSAVLLRLDARRLAEPSSSQQQEPRMEYDGSGVSAVLAEMALNAPDEFENIQEALRQVIPDVRRIRFARSPVQGQGGHHIVVDMHGAPDIPASAVSEGTLLVIGLLTVIMGPERPRLVLLDDIERGLHPKAARDFVAQLRIIQGKHPDMQIIATSHSPYLVDHFDPSEVRLSALDADGAAVFAKLTDHPEFERWKDQMAPGEFWGTFGENWVTEQAARKNG